MLLHHALTLIVISIPPPRTLHEFLSSIPRHSSTSSISSSCAQNLPKNVTPYKTSKNFHNTLTNQHVPNYELSNISDLHTQHSIDESKSLPKGTSDIVIAVIIAGIMIVAVVCFMNTLFRIVRGPTDTTQQSADTEDTVHDAATSEEGGGLVREGSSEDVELGQRRSVETLPKYEEPPAYDAERK